MPGRGDDRAIDAGGRDMIGKIVGAAAIAGTCFTVNANAEEQLWTLLGLDVHMGAVSARDTVKDADARPEMGEGLPTFPDRQACEAALHHALHKYDGKSHAEGNYGWFQCVNVFDWPHAGDATGLSGAASAWPAVSRPRSEKGADGAKATDDARADKIMRLWNAPGPFSEARYHQLKQLCRLGRGIPTVGMTARDVAVTQWCVPFAGCNVTSTASGEHLQCKYYRNQDMTRADAYVYFDNGIVTAVQY
jgi:hypothetical protein